MAKKVLSQYVQKSFVYLIISNDTFIRIARENIQPHHFKSKVIVNILEICYNFFDMFGKAPKDHIHDELVSFLNNKPEDEVDQYIDYLEQLEDLEKPNYEYIVKSINDFVQLKTFEEAALQFVRMIEQEKLEEARELMFKSLKTGIQSQEAGINYFECKTPSYLLEEYQEEFLICPTGFELIDERIRGIKRKQLICILGGAKGKKSWTCHMIGKQALLHGRKVLHISHENSAEETEKRYDMMFYGLSGEPKGETIVFEELDESGDIVKKWSEYVSSVYDQRLTLDRRKFFKKFGGELVIKKYPQTQCTFGEVERYVNYLEAYEEFVPDIIINDYPDVMRLGGGGESWDKLNDIYGKFKGMADERNIAVIVPSQVKNKYLTAKKLDKSAPAGDTRKIANVDMMLSVNQVPDEETKMMAYVLGNRNGPDNFGCMFSTNLNIGQLATNCWPIARDADEEDE